MLLWLISRWYSGFMCCSCCVWNVCLCSPLAVKMWSDESSRAWDKTTSSRLREWTKASWEPKTNCGASHAQTQQSKNVFSTSSCTKITFQSTLDTSDLEDSWEFSVNFMMQKKRLKVNEQTVMQNSSRKFQENFKKIDNEGKENFSVPFAEKFAFKTLWRKKFFSNTRSTRTWCYCFCWVWSSGRAAVVVVAAPPA